MVGIVCEWNGGYIGGLGSGWQRVLVGREWVMGMEEMESWASGW